MAGLGGAHMASAKCCCRAGIPPLPSSGRLCVRQRAILMNTHARPLKISTSPSW